MRSLVSLLGMVVLVHTGLAEAQGMTGLGSGTRANAVSDDGSAVVGFQIPVSPPYDGAWAFRWTRGAGIVDLGVIAGAYYSLGEGVSSSTARPVKLWWMRPGGGLRRVVAIPSASDQLLLAGAPAILHPTIRRRRLPRVHHPRQVEEAPRRWGCT